MDVKDTLFFTRIKKIDFIDFRNIEKGSVEFPNSTIDDFHIGNPSIVGLYGQNGSGKSSVIMALGILKDVLSGKSIGNKYESCIRYGCDRCTLSFSFSMYSKLINKEGEAVLDNENDACYDVFYSFDIARLMDESAQFNFELSSNENEILIIENEIFKFRVRDGKGNVVMPKQTFIDTTGIAKKKNTIFGSEQKRLVYTFNDANIEKQYMENYAVTKSKSQSFIFSLKTIKYLLDVVEMCGDIDEVYEGAKQQDAMIKAAENSMEFNSNMKDFYASEDDNNKVWTYLCFMFIPIFLIKGLNAFGSAYLHVIDTVTTGLTNINTQLPLLLWTKLPNQGVFNYRISLKMDGPTHVPEKTFNFVKHSLKSVSDVLEKIVPSVRLSFTDLGKGLSSNSEEEHYFEISSVRENTTIPLKYESDGIRRIVSILSLLIAVYNDESFTVAIDEIDSGIFEYLLGEILSVMSESVKGQLIFTSHNLRALEVLPAKYLCFTTTDPEKRFTKISNRGNSNLRDTYFRSIVLNTQKEQVYKPTDKYEIELALYRAGHDWGEE